jgi:hypothetical protein
MGQIRCIEILVSNYKPMQTTISAQRIFQNTFGYKIYFTAQTQPERQFLIGQTEI